MSGLRDLAPVGKPSSLFQIFLSQKEGRLETVAVQFRHGVVELAVEPVVIGQTDRRLCAARPAVGRPRRAASRAAHGAKTQAESYAEQGTAGKGFKGTHADA